MEIYPGYQRFFLGFGNVILLSAVAKYDAKFTFQALDSLSFFTEKATNHFELLVFVSTQSLRPSEIRVQEDEMHEGLAFIEMEKDTNTSKTWKSLCRKSESEKEYLLSKMVRCELSNLLSKLLADMLYLEYHDKTLEGIEIRNISSENTVTLEIQTRGLGRFPFVRTGRPERTGSHRSTGSRN